MKDESLTNLIKLTAAAEDLLRKLEPGDIILASNRWVSKLSDLSSCAIRLANFTRKGPEKRFWTHSAMYLGESRIIEAFPAPLGIIVRDIREQYLSNPDFKIKAMRLRNRTQEERNRAANKCLELGEGKSYDFVALLYFVLAYVTPAYLSFILDDAKMGRWLNTVDKYFCSELVSDGFFQAGVYCFDREPYQIMPAHFDNDLVFEEVGHLDIRNPGFILRMPEGLKMMGYYVMLITWAVLPLALIAGVFLVVTWRLKVNLFGKKNTKTRNP